MDRISKSQPHARRGQYDANYGNFQTDLYEQIRREALARMSDKIVGLWQTNRTDSCLRLNSIQAKKSSM
jgi:hypothetical protein